MGQRVIHSNICLCVIMQSGFTYIYIVIDIYCTFDVYVFVLVFCYFQLQHLGREYPGGADKFRTKCHDAFMRNSQEKDSAKIDEMIKRGDFVVKEIEALYSLRKYRAMKKRYYD